MKRMASVQLHAAGPSRRRARSERSMASGAVTGILAVILATAVLALAGAIIAFAVAMVF
ncbi:MAG TPA: hypothetical protein VML96_12415 [Egibacteraceae bacterium]|nr:hypothetical protein [Egibacteraceae bacterium]